MSAGGPTYRIGHVTSLVDEIVRYRDRGDVVLETQARRQLDEILSIGIEHARSKSVREELASALASIEVQS